MKSILNVIAWICIAGIASIFLLTLLQNVNLFNGYKLFIVQSGSMEPAIRVGDLIVIKNAENYYKGEVVTFKSEDGRVVTHRIYSTTDSEGDKPLYVTKGDANRSEDNDTTVKDQVLGKVVLVVPKIGYFSAFARSLPGLILLILLPALIIVGDEIFSLIKR